MTRLGRWSSGWRGGALATALYTALAVWMTWPLALRPGRDLLGVTGDPEFQVWLIWQRARDGIDLGLPVLREIAAPYGFEFTGGIVVQYLTLDFPAWVIARTGLSEVTAYNAIVFTALPLAGAAAYLVARRFGTGFGPALWAGLVFMIFPWHVRIVAGHYFASHIEWFPLLVLAGLRWWERPTLLRAVVVAAVVAALAYQTSYFLLFAAIPLGVIVVAAVLGGAERVPVRSAAVLVAVCVVPLVPQAVIGVAQLDEIRATEVRSVADLDTFGARPSELFTLPPINNPVGDRVAPVAERDFHRSGPYENQLYLGVVTLLLALVGVVAVGFGVGAGRDWTRRQRRLARIAPVIFGLAFLLSLPSPLEIGPTTITWTPARVVYEVLPFLRTYSRVVVVMMTALVLAGALGLEAIRRRLGSGRPVLGVVVVVVAIGLSGLELGTTNRSEVRDVSVVPPQYAYLQGIDQADVVADYPWDGESSMNVYRAAFWQRAHGHPITSGLLFGRALVDLRTPTRDLRDPEAARVLAFAGVRWVVLDRNRYDPGQQMAAPPFGPVAGLTRVAAYPDGAEVYRVSAPPAAGFAAPATGDPGWSGLTPSGLDGTAAEFGSTHQLSASGGLDVVVDRPGRYELTVGAVSLGQPVRVSLWSGERPLADLGTAGPTPVVGRATVDLPEGVSRLTLRTAPLDGSFAADPLAMRATIGRLRVTRAP